VDHAWLNNEAKWAGRGMSPEEAHSLGKAWQMLSDRIANGSAKVKRGGKIKNQ
jgi:hypothetical protein